MAGDIKDKYVASSALTVTNLHSLGSSQDWTTGWGSAAINNTSNVYLDYIYAASFTTHASNRQAGAINIYVIGALNDTPLYPAVASGTAGTEGAISFVDTEERNSACVLLDSIEVDNSASSIVYLKPTAIAQLFGGELPPYFFLFVAQNAATTTTAGLASSGSAIYQTPKLKQYT